MEVNSTDADHAMIPERLMTPFGSTMKKGGCVPFPYADPLRRSTQSSLPFPTKAAAALAEQRGQRYDELDGSIEEVELRLRELASVMGLFSWDDDMPTAA